MSQTEGRHSSRQTPPSLMPCGSPTLPVRVNKKKDQHDPQMSRNLIDRMRASDLLLSVLLMLQISDSQNLLLATSLMSQHRLQLPPASTTHFMATTTSPVFPLPRVEMRLRALRGGEGGLVRCLFQVRAEQTKPGDRVVLAGSGESLRNWNKENAILLSTTIEDFPVWSVEVLLPVADKVRDCCMNHTDNDAAMQLTVWHQQVEFKFAIRRADGKLCWEPGTNHVCIIPDQDRPVLSATFADPPVIQGILCADRQQQSEQSRRFAATELSKEAQGCERVLVSADHARPRVHLWPKTFKHPSRGRPNTFQASLTGFCWPRTCISGSFHSISSSVGRFIRRHLRVSIAELSTLLLRVSLAVVVNILLLAYVPTLPVFQPAAISGEVRLEDVDTVETLGAMSQSDFGSTETQTNVIEELTTSSPQHSMAESIATNALGLAYWIVSSNLVTFMRFSALLTGA